MRGIVTVRTFSASSLLKIVAAPMIGLTSPRSSNCERSSVSRVSIVAEADDDEEETEEDVLLDSDEETEDELSFVADAVGRHSGNRSFLIALRAIDRARE